MKRIILFDCDGVLADFAGAFLDEVRHLTGARHVLDDVHTWNLEQCDFFKNLEKAHPGLKDKVWRRVNVQGWAHDIAPLEHAHAMVEVARKFGDLYIVTSPLQSSDSWARDRERWLQKHFGIPSRNVIHCAAKHLVRGDVFVDDKPEHVIEWREAWKGRAGLLWDAPYNRHAKEADKIRVYDVDDLHEAIAAYFEENR